MRELIAIFMVTLTIYLGIWSSVFGLYFILAGTIWGMGQIYTILGSLLMFGSFILNYYIRSRL